MNRKKKKCRFSVFLKDDVAAAILRLIPRGARSVWLSKVLVEKFESGELDYIIPVKERIKIRELIEAERQKVNKLLN